MNHTLRIPLIVVTGLVVATSVTACTGSDAQDSSGDDQARVAQLLVSTADEEGFGIDTECVTAYAAELSDDDAQALVDAGLAGEADVSAEGAAIGADVFRDCVDAASYAEAVADALAEADASIDADCLRGALSGLTTDEIDEQLVDRVEDCSSDA